MIEIYDWPTPDGRKISIMLEECGLPYEVRRVDGTALENRERRPAARLLPWIMTHNAQGLTLDDYPGLERWFAAIRARDAVQRGLALGREHEGKEPDDKARAFLFKGPAASPAAEPAPSSQDQP